MVKNIISKDINRIKEKYKVSRQEAKTLLETRLSGICQCCNRPPRFDAVTTHIDHCHLTGIVRGVVCASCNIVIGRIENNLKTHHKQCHLDWIENDGVYG